MRTQYVIINDTIRHNFSEKAVSCSTHSDFFIFKLINFSSKIQYHSYVHTVNMKLQAAARGNIYPGFAL